MEAEDLTPYIPDYLLGNIPEDIHQAFDELLTKDLEFAREVESQKQLFLAAQLFGSDGLSDKIQKIQSQQKGRSIPKSTIYWFSGAAAIILILVAIGLTMNSDRQAKAERFLATAHPDNISEVYAEQLNNPGFTDTENIPILLDGMNAYRAGKLDSAEFYLRDYLVNDPDNSEVLFYLAETFWQQKKPQEAILVWQKVTLAPISFNNQARLRLAAAYLSLGEQKKADSLVNILEESASPDIQQQVDEFW